MSNCRLNNLSNKSVHDIGVALKEERVWQEDLKPPAEAPTYVSSVVNDDTGGNTIQKLGQKMLDISGDFLSYLNSFESLYFKPFTNSSELGSGYSKLVNYVETTDPKFAIVGVRGGKETVVGALPRANEEFVQTNSLLKRLLSLISGGKIPINKGKMLQMVARAYDSSNFKANPLRLSKWSEGYPPQSITALKAKYGDNYPYIFSSPRIVTARLVGEDFRGRSVIFYNKFPENGLTVDEILDSFGTNRDVSDKRLGMIPLRKYEYQNFDKLLEDVDRFNSPNYSDPEKGSFAYDDSVEEFFVFLKTKHLNTPFKFKVDDLRVRSHVIYESGETEIAGNDVSIPNFLKALKEIREEDQPFFNKLNAELGNFKKGIRINPTIIPNITEYSSGFAKTDTSLRDGDNIFIEDTLFIEGLEQNIVQPPRLQFQMVDTENDINTLLSSTPVEIVTQLEDTSPLEYNSAKKNAHYGKSITPDLNMVIQEFENLGIFAEDVGAWVKNMTSQALLNNDSDNMADYIIKQLEENSKDQKYCI